MKRQPPSNRNPDKTPPPQTLEDHVTQLGSQLELLKTQVRQAQQMASLGTAAAMLAHEVNNLLTPILSYSTSAMQTEDIAFARKALSVTAQNARMLISMSSRMLELGAAKPHEREIVDVQKAVAESRASMCRDFEKDGTSFAMKIEEGLSVFADPLQLRQILFNLFLNAQEAMAATHSGRLTVTANRLAANNLVTIEVRNTGPVIPPDLLPNIFEPFQSSKPALRNGKARCSGLGLALVRDLVRENDGTIDVSSNEKDGTTFRITLPGSGTA